jgi:hypothetical protein
LKADALGFLVLAGLFFVISAFPVVRQNMDGVGWLLTYVIGVACAAFVWHHEKAPKTPRKWLMLALISLVGALLFYGFSRLAAVVFFSTEPEASRFFDIGLTVLIAPGLTFISIAGAARAAFKSR